MGSVVDRYRAAFEADPEAQARWASREAFVRIEGRSKVNCATCHRAGYGGLGGPDQKPAPWQYPCLLGHDPCSSGCGRQFIRRYDGTPKTHGHHRHACPGPKEEHP